MSADFARIETVPSVVTHRYTQYISKDTQHEVVWALPHGANPANVAAVPAAQFPDLQTFFFGKMSHGLTLRPYRVDNSCCGDPGLYRFDLAKDAFSDRFGSGTIKPTCCGCGASEVEVDLPTGKMTGTIDRPSCTCQPRTEMTWTTGEVMSYRMMPCIICCGPWRTGFVGTAPGEEDQNQIRYWAMNGSYLDCHTNCCGPCVRCCDCRDTYHFTTWQPNTMESERTLHASRFHFALRSAFGVPSLEEGVFRQPTSEGGYLSDFNALGDSRVHMKVSACCGASMIDPSDSSNNSETSGFDLTFRGTFNQNQLDPKDFALALGFLILNNKFFMDGLRALKGDPLRAARQSVPGAFWQLHEADVRPNVAAIQGTKMV